MKEDYTIEFLEKLFKQHSEEFEDRYQSNPHKDENFESFNLSYALHLICKEINTLKK